MNSVEEPLREAPTAEQRVMYGLISDVFFKRAPSRWPSGKWVAHEMAKQSLDLDQVVATLPSIRYGAHGPGYRGIWTASSPASNDGPIMLTIAGLAHTPFPDGSATREFIAVVRAMADRYANASLDPYEPGSINYSRAEAAALLRKPDDSIQWLAELFQHERPTWGQGLEEADPWTLRLSANLVPFVGVHDLDDYMARVRNALDPPRGSEVESLLEPSGLPLVEEIAFLDTAWRLAYGERLFAWPPPPVAVRLSEEAESSDAFSSRMNALIDMLKAMQLTEPAGKHVVERLHHRLSARLSEVDLSSLDPAFATLRAVSDIRNVGVHHNAALKATTAARVLGVAYPIVDWHRSWRQIRDQTSAAIARVRTALLATTN